MSCSARGRRRMMRQSTATTAAAPASTPAGPDATTVLTASSHAICAKLDAGRRIFPACLLPCVALSRRPCRPRIRVEGASVTTAYNVAPEQERERQRHAMAELV
jgi:hypothetical protein